MYLLVFNAAKPNYRRMEYWVRSILVSQTREPNSLTKRDWNTPIVSSSLPPHSRVKYPLMAILYF